MAPLIAVMDSKMTTGCSTIKTEAGLDFFRNNCLDVMPFDDVLTKQHRTDAHFVCYSVTHFPMWPRCNKSLLEDVRSEGEDIVLSIFAFDWDNPEHAIWTEKGLEQFARRIDNLANVDPLLASWSAVYTTKHGARLIYTLSEPIKADDAEQNLVWMLRKFYDKGFAEIDQSCKDWTRCFRCPQVNRDGKRTEKEWYYFLQQRPDQVLQIDKLGKLPTGTIARVKEFDKMRYIDQPHFEELERLLTGQNPETKKSVQSDFYKKAKKVLKSTPYFDVLFNHTPPCWPVGTRNDEVMKMLGIITPILIDKCRATIQQIFALAIYPVLTLEDIPGKIPPTKHCWNALRDIYERENNRANILAAEKAEKVYAETKLLDKIINGMKEWCTHSDLHGDEETARDFCRTRCLATVGNFFYMIGEGGYFDSFPINQSQVISRIRKSHLKDIVPTSKPNRDGEQVDVTIQTIQNNYSTAVSEIIVKPVGDKGGFITGIDGEKPALILSSFSRNPNLRGEYNQYVDKWLRCLFGKDYEVGCAWIGNSLAFEDGLICALSLEGASNAGKKLLSVGLSECLKEPHIAGPMDIYGTSSAFLKTPFLVINEAWPDSRIGISPADTFKGLTGGDGIRVNEKYKPTLTVLCPVRIILTANDDGIIRTLTKDKDMTLDNRIAIGQRLLHIRVPTMAQAYLQEIGGMGFTARAGQRWIRPDSGNMESDYVVAKHFMWLYETRKPVDKTQRFLVMGNSAPGCGDNGQMTIFEKVLADGNSTPVVALAIIEMADKGKGIWSQYIRIDINRGKVYVTRYGVDRYVKEVLGHRILERDLFRSMGNLLAQNEPLTADDRNHWYEINVEALAMIAFERSIPQTVIGKLYEIVKGIKDAEMERETFNKLIEEEHERKALGIV